MAKFDIHNHLNFKPGLYPLATAGADNTALVSQIVDTLGYGSVEFVVLTGTLADADATFAFTIQDGDVSNLSDAATVSADQLLGTTAAASFTFADDNKCFKIGYVGNKRYVRATVTPANNTGAAPIAGVWVLGKPILGPTSNPPA
jgi:hypothetical protein